MLTRHHLLAILFLCISPVVFATNAPLRLYSPVNLEQFVGTWYEIEALPNYFQKDCRCTTDKYFKEGSSYRLINQCQKTQKNNQFSISSAAITIIKNTKNAGIKAQFVWPVKTSYYVIYHDPDYRYCLVGNKARSKLWLMSRTTTIDEKARQLLYKIAKKEQYDISKLIKIDQSCHDTTASQSTKTMTTHIKINAA